MSGFIKFAAETGPLLVFFLVYKAAGMMPATLALLLTTLIAVAVTYKVEKKLAIAPLVSAAILGLFATLTLFSGNPVFIKIKPTIVNSVFAVILLGGVFFGKGLLKYIFGMALELTDEGWRKFSLHWGVFFLFLAGLNEFIWRSYPEDFWVNFKVFGMFPLTVLFTLVHLPFFKKYRPTDSASG